MSDKHLTSLEVGIVQTLADAYIAFSRLPAYHPTDQAEFVQAIHAAQQIVMQRLAVRAHPDVFVQTTASLPHRPQTSTKGR